VKSALVISVIALGGAWMLLYGAGPLGGLAVVVESFVLIALAFAYGSRTAAKHAGIGRFDDDGGG
jgi:hypothetical protein